MQSARTAIFPKLEALKGYDLKAIISSFAYTKQKHEVML